MNKKLFYGICAVVVVILLFFGLSHIKNNEETGSVKIPNTLANLPRTAFISGPEAEQQITQMHGKNIPLSEGYVARFGNGGKQVMLWISVSPSKEEGEQLFKLMDERMPASKVFTGRKPVTIDGRSVINVQGMGQEHYYWVDGKVNYWVALMGVDAEAVVREVLSQNE